MGQDLPSVWVNVWSNLMSRHTKQGLVSNAKHKEGTQYRLKLPLKNMQGNNKRKKNTSLFGKKKKKNTFLSCSHLCVLPSAYFGEKGVCLCKCLTSCLCAEAVYVPPTLPGGCRRHGAPAAAAWTAGPSVQCWGHGAPWAEGRAWTSDPTAERHQEGGWRCSEGWGWERKRRLSCRMLSETSEYKS